MISCSLGTWSFGNKARKEHLLNRTHLLLKTFQNKDDDSAPPHLRARIPHWVICFYSNYTRCFRYVTERAGGPSGISRWPLNIPAVIRRGKPL